MCRWTSFVVMVGWCSEVIAWINYRKPGGLLEKEQ